MTQIAVAGNAFPVWMPAPSPRQTLANETFENYPERRYLSMQLDPIISEASTPHRWPTHEIQVLLGVPMPLQSQSFRRETSKEAILDPLDSLLERQQELIEIPQGRPSNIEATERRAKALFLLPLTLSESSQRVLSENGLSRFEEFKRYPDGWDYGRGSALSPRSVRLLNSFLKDVPELEAYEPSLFLTHQGNLQLGWEDANRNVVELEFFPDRIDYYVELLNEEGSVRLQDRLRLIEKIRSTIE